MSTPVFDSDVYDSDSRYKDDDKLVVFFHVESIQNKFKSNEAGRPIFEDVPHITIITPGSRDTFVGKATDEYKRRFPRQWAQFEAKENIEESGTPLSAVPWLTRSQIAEFNAVQIRSVEQLANLSDSLGQKFMGIQQIKARAKMFLEAAAGEAVHEKMRKELEQRDEQIAALQQQVEQLMKAQTAAKPAATQKA